MDLVNEKHSRDQLSNSLIDIPIDDFVDLLTKLIREISLFGFHELAHN
jgi:hypothetical protein